MEERPTKTDMGWSPYEWNQTHKVDSDLMSKWVLFILQTYFYIMTVHAMTLIMWYSREWESYSDMTYLATVPLINYSAGVVIIRSWENNE